MNARPRIAYVLVLAVLGGIVLAGWHHPWKTTGVVLSVLIFTGMVMQEFEKTKLRRLHINKLEEEDKDVS